MNVVNRESCGSNRRVEKLSALMFDRRQRSIISFTYELGQIKSEGAHDAYSSLSISAYSNSIEWIIGTQFENLETYG